MNQLYVTHAPGLQGHEGELWWGGVIKVQSEYAGVSFRVFCHHHCCCFQNSWLILSRMFVNIQKNTKLNNNSCFGISSVRGHVVSTASDRRLKAHQQGDGSYGKFTGRWCFITQAAVSRHLHHSRRGEERLRAQHGGH